MKNRDCTHIVSCQITETDYYDYLALAIYFSGCDRMPKCEGCHAKDLWDSVCGMEEDEVCNYIRQYIEFIRNIGEEPKIVILGGEPLSKDNRYVINRLLFWFGDDLCKNVMIYTWRTVDKSKMILEELGIKKYVEYLCCGHYEMRQSTGEFPASSNQKVVEIGE